MATFLIPQEFKSIFTLSSVGGSAFASPCIDEQLRVVYAATLAGHLTAFHAVSCDNFVTYISDTT